VVSPNTTVQSKEATLIYYHFRLDYNEVFILRDNLSIISINNIA
jgi:hypothetical protein